MQPVIIIPNLEKRPSRVYRFAIGLLKFSVGLIIFLSISFIAARLWLMRSDGGPGKPPAGYSSMTELYGAIILGAIPLMDRQPPIPPDIEYKSGVTYARVGDIELKLDIYRPLKAPKDQRRPLFVLIHGGGWKSGQREDYRPHALRVAKAGYVVASLSYRLSDVAKFPAAVRDVNAALQFLADHSDEYGLDPLKMVVMGGSAGGYLSMLAGYSNDPQFRPESDPTFKPVRAADQKQVPLKIASIFNFYGPCDLTTDFAKNVDVVRGFMGTTYDKDPELYRNASPLFDIKSGAPPTLIVHGTIDDIVPVEQSDELAEALKKANVPVRYERMKGWPHTMDMAGPMFEYICGVILEELKTHAGRPD
jgi:acetyl esterase/lipase